MEWGEKRKGWRKRRAAGRAFMSESVSPFLLELTHRLEAETADRSRRLIGQSMCHVLGVTSSSSSGLGGRKGERTRQRRRRRRRRMQTTASDIVLTSLYPEQTSRSRIVVDLSLSLNSREQQTLRSSFGVTSKKRLAEEHLGLINLESPKVFRKCIGIKLTLSVFRREMAADCMLSL